MISFCRVFDTVLRYSQKMAIFFKYFEIMSANFKNEIVLFLMRPTTALFKKIKKIGKVRVKFSRKFGSFGMEWPRRKMFYIASRSILTENKALPDLLSMLKLEEVTAFIFLLCLIG